MPYYILHTTCCRPLIFLPHATCHILHAAGLSYALLHATSYMLHATYCMPLLHTTRYILHTICYMLHSTYYILHTTCYTLHTTHYMLQDLQLPSSQRDRDDREAALERSLSLPASSGPSGFLAPHERQQFLLSRALDHNVFDSGNLPGQEPKARPGMARSKTGLARSYNQH